MNSREKIVELSGVTLQSESGGVTFDKLDLTLLAGETAILIGPTAAGKTLLVELIMGARKADRGEVRVFGKAVNPRSHHLINSIRGRIGGVGGIFNLIPAQRVIENLQYPLLIRGSSASLIKTRLQQIMGQFGLQKKKRMKTERLSRGEKIMVLLARAIIADQPLLLIDEPLDRLDDATAGEVLNQIKRLQAAGHTMLILTTGQIALDIPGASIYRLKEGRLQ